MTKLDETNNILHIISTIMFCKIHNGQDEEYFAKRLDLFKKYTLNSIVNQTNQNFH